MDSLQRNGLTITWLNGGVVNLDGGAMFGVVPKPLWERKYPVNERNQVETPTDPMLIQKDGYTILVDAGIGKGRLTDKQKRNYGVTRESMVENDLKKLDLGPEDIDLVIMTHLHFDHATGLVKGEEGKERPCFSHAKIIVSEVEWSEMREPNIRSQNTYWEKNWRPIEHQVETFTNEKEVIPGIKVIHTGGHSDGHSIVILEHEEETYIHLADIMPTHAHENALWVTAYDDFPLDSIAAKLQWTAFAQERKAWYLFYHDCMYRALKRDSDGNISQVIERKSL
ncbi:YtnP family quorum-quenching lactonase [Halalkalibacter urbisdiaboli]|uniref:YtnP family quorum-quenching lactonase n=1 Tax=Halalkalibacter urbisdiaboli TaxID=1960589 RepID=UPI000B43C8E2|nr:MBL fold metallo-hydrolase [Halalkalibacter urbisdiaboli]